MHTYPTGLVLGRFMPPHAGHLYLIERAAAQVGRLELILLSRTEDSIPGSLRAGWLEQLVPGNVRLWHVANRHPRDYSDPDVWQKWRKLVESVLPESPDLVFSSEDYGNQLAELLRAQHVMIDPARREVPVSASQIRNDPMTHWVYLPEPARDWFVRRTAVLLDAPQSAEEISRRIADRAETACCSWPASASSLLSAEQARETARAQIECERQTAFRANRVLLCPGSLIGIRLHTRPGKSRIAELSPKALARRYPLILSGPLDALEPGGRAFLRRLRTRCRPGQWIDLPAAPAEAFREALLAVFRLADPCADS